MTVCGCRDVAGSSPSMCFCHTANHKNSAALTDTVTHTKLTNQHIARDEFPYQSPGQRNLSQDTEDQTASDRNSPHGQVPPTFCPRPLLTSQVAILVPGELHAGKAVLHSFILKNPELRAASASTSSCGSSKAGPASASQRRLRTRQVCSHYPSFEVHVDDLGVMDKGLEAFLTRELCRGISWHSPNGT